MPASSIVGDTERVIAPPGPERTEALTDARGSSPGIVTPRYPTRPAGTGATVRSRGTAVETQSAEASFAASPASSIGASAGTTPCWSTRNGPDADQAGTCWPAGSSAEAGAAADRRATTVHSLSVIDV